MIRVRLFAMLLGVLVAAGALGVVPARVAAHCDTMSGPVVQAAREALQKQDVRLALIWVKESEEPAIRDAFQHTLAVRKLGPAARELADQWFFETLVRVHRAGEGAPYTGLKPAGLDLGPAIPAADRSLESGDLAPMTRMLTEAVNRSLRESFEAALAARKYAPGDVAAGRKYVAAYVTFIHRAEALWQTATRSPEGHYEEAEALEAPASPHVH